MYEKKKIYKGKAKRYCFHYVTLRFGLYGFVTVRNTVFAVCAAFFFQQFNGV